MIREGPKDFIQEWKDDKEDDVPTTVDGSNNEKSDGELLQKELSELDEQTWKLIDATDGFNMFSNTSNSPVSDQYEVRGCVTNVFSNLEELAAWTQDMT